MVFAGCTKETSTVENASNDNGGRIVTLSAKLPQFTKAIVDDTQFTWTAGDKIAVPATGITGGYAIFENSTEDVNKFTYELQDGEALASGTAIYPAGATENYSFETIADAQKGFRMEADFVAGETTSLDFEHKSALVKLTFTNVPSFATNLKVSDGSNNTICTVSIGSGEIDEEVTFYAPLPAATKATFALMENENILASKNTKGEIETGSYYAPAAIAVNPYLVLENAVASSEYKLGLQTRDVAGDDNKSSTYGEWYGNQATIAINGGTSRYYIIPDALISDSKAVRIVLYVDNVEKSATSRIFLDRNPRFDVSDNSLKTDYRFYPYYSGSFEHPYIYAFKYSPITVEVVNQHDTEYNPYIYLWYNDGSNDVTIGSAWPGTLMSDSGETDGNNIVWTYTIPDQYYFKTVKFVISDNGKEDSKQEDNVGVSLTSGVTGWRTYIGSWGISTPTEAYKYNTTTISSSWPGDALTGLSSNRDEEIFYELSGSDYYGVPVYVIVSDNGNNQTADIFWSVDRDVAYSVEPKE